MRCGAAPLGGTFNRKLGGLGCAGQRPKTSGPDPGGSLHCNLGSQNPATDCPPHGAERNAEMGSKQVSDEASARWRDTLVRERAGGAGKLLTKLSGFGRIAGKGFVTRYSATVGGERSWEATVGVALHQGMWSATGTFMDIGVGIRG